MFADTTVQLALLLCTREVVGSSTVLCTALTYFSEYPKANTLTLLQYTAAASFPIP